jgi:thymidylate synthase
LDELDPYWADVGRLFGIYALTRGQADVPRERLRQVADLSKAMSSDFYGAYIRKRSKKLTQQIALLDLDGSAEQQGEKP